MLPGSRVNGEISKITRKTKEENWQHLYKQGRRNVFKLVPNIFTQTVQAQTTEIVFFVVVSPNFDVISVNYGREPLYGTWQHWRNGPMHK